ncbi:hypothetical protein [Lysinibacillus sp. Bpr_S20]|uniref:hypothetical protein n=1 Tax=Lysinibacillus sp. Bpr_S20 TaxID=2933964 RepID=UPI002010E8F8|nr:hypothetical protein [Lysinibacillus sp. Bpr_S20]MCL1699322.1 hypothetical protein [Lysinibacillus sp. Bpr_S20]
MDVDKIQKLGDKTQKLGDKTKSLGDILLQRQNHPQIAEEIYTLFNLISLQHEGRAIYLVVFPFFLINACNVKSHSVLFS